MLIWIRRHNGVIIFALTLLIVLLVLSNAWKHNVISSDWLRTQKDAFAALSSIATTVLLIAGAIFSYYRFFKGRLLAAKAELKLSVSVHPTSANYLIHAITLNAKNVGSSTIWNPKPLVTIYVHSAPPSFKKEEITEWDTPRSAIDVSDSFPVIESEESISFFAIRHIEKRVWAVTYMASVAADTGDAWFATCTVTNSPSDKSPARGSD